MRKTSLVACLAVVLGVVATDAVAAPTGVALTVTPSIVHRGGLVLIRGNAGSCPVGDTVTVMSRAFGGAHSFAGVPAVLTKVRAHHRFRASTRIPSRKRLGRYVVTARCGGGNLGVGAHLRVLR